MSSDLSCSRLNFEGLSGGSRGGGVGKRGRRGCECSVSQRADSVSVVGSRQCVSVGEMSGGVSQSHQSAVHFAVEMLKLGL